MSEKRPDKQRREPRARSPGGGDPAAYLAGGAARLGTAGVSAGSGHLGWERTGPSPYFSRGTRGLPPRLQQFRPARAFGARRWGSADETPASPSAPPGFLIQLTGGRRRRAGSAQAGGAGGGGLGGQRRLPPRFPLYGEGAGGCPVPGGGLPCPAESPPPPPPLVGDTGRQPCEELPVRVMLGPTPSWPFFSVLPTGFGALVRF